MKSLIVVASHKNLGVEKLSYPYVEVYRTDKKEDFEHNIYKLDGIKNPIVSWSEYGQFFYPFPIDNDIETFGLVHYRCMLNLENNKNIDKLPYSERKSFYDNQLHFLESAKDKVIVGDPLQFELSAWEQFSIPFPDIESTFLLACKEFDKIVGNVDSEHDLKSKNKLYSRNIFISPAEFAKKWYDISRRLVSYLDTVSPYGTDPRWGGYILERLFSVYIGLHINNYKDLVITRPLVFFE